VLTLYTHNTPNGHKIAIALEELGLPYEVVRVNVHTGAQFAPDFMQLNPNAKVPVLRDDETGVVTAESNAILLYLAEKTGRLMPKGPVGRAKLVELLFFQAASLGPMFGQRAHFALFAPEHVTMPSSATTPRATASMASSKRIWATRTGWSTTTRSPTSPSLPG
jgi:GSH-dependent disulfide-bond oxidoreductase